LSKNDAIKPAESAFFESRVTGCPPMARKVESILALSLDVIAKMQKKMPADDGSMMARPSWRPS